MPKFNLDNRIECIVKNNGFLTLKDHKQNFRLATPCHLINPCKSEFGKMSKVILKNDNKSLIEKLNVNQWKNTNGYPLVQIHRAKVKILLYSSFI